MKFDDGPPPDAAIAQGLSALKRDGGSVLVTGAATEAHGAACREFLGGETERIVVCTEGSVRSDCDDAEPTTVIERPVKTRSAAAAAPNPPTELESIGREIRTSIERLSVHGSSVRVCVDSLRPFVDETDRSRLVAFLRDVRDAARATGAIAHLHLPAAPEAVPPGLLEPVDAVVELQQIDECTYQQWHLPETGTTSSWVDL